MRYIYYVKLELEFSSNLSKKSNIQVLNGSSAPMYLHCNNRISFEAECKNVALDGTELFPLFILS